MEINLPKEEKIAQDNYLKSLYYSTLSLLEDEICLKYSKDKNIYFIEDVFSDDFWHDFIVDTCNLDVASYIKPLIKQIYKTLDFLKENPNIEKYTEKDWEKFYNYKKINYKKRITYKLFKEIVSETPSLIQFLHLQLDLANNLKNIEASKWHSVLPINIDCKQLFTKAYLLKIEPDMQEVLNIGTIELINNLEDLSNAWFNCRKFALNYWLWIWLSLSLSVNCFEMFYQIKNLSEQYMQDCEEKFWDGRLKKNKEEDTFLEAIPKKPHNAYNERENHEWYKCRNVYNSSINQYQITKHLTLQIYNNFNYYVALDNLEKIIFKDDYFYRLCKEILNDLYDCNKECLSCKHRTKKTCNNMQQQKIFIKLKKIIIERLPVIEEIIIKDKNINNIKNLYAFIKNTSKQDFSLLVLKQFFNIVDGKSDKTIINKISDIEYLLKKDKCTFANMNKDIKNIEELDFIGQIKFYLQRIANDLINIANSYNQNTLNDLLSDLVKLEELVKKSQA